MLYSEEQARRALELYMETRSVTKTIRQLRSQGEPRGLLQVDK